MDKSTLRVTFLHRGLAWLEFTRAKQLNTFSRAQCLELVAALKELNENPSCKVLVITGHGRLFSAGVDINEMVEAVKLIQKQATETTDPYESQIKLWEAHLQAQAGEVIRAMINFNKILIYAPNGGCVGLSCTISQLADYVVMPETGFFSTPFMSLNFCAEGCSSYTFPKVLGPQMANNMLLNSHRLTSAEALRYNFVTNVFPDKEFHKKTLEFAVQHAKFDSEALQITKALIRPEKERKLLNDVNDIELKQLAHCLTGPKAQHALISFVEQQIQNRKKAEAEKKQKLLDQSFKNNEIRSKTSPTTERIDHMITSMGGWNVPPPPPNSVLSDRISLSRVPPKVTEQPKTAIEAGIFVDDNATVMKPNVDTMKNTSSHVVIQSKHLQLNATVNNNKKKIVEDDGDQKIDAFVSKKPPAEERPYEPIPPILV